MPAPVPEWRELIRSGSLRSAFAAAEARGFDKVCGEATAAELLALGDGARLSGRPERANQALRLLRLRYPADSRRAAAAFALGKVAFDEARDYRQAAEWFSISIREQPGGSLSREARGRLLEALHRAGEAGKAKRAAEEYLERHPSGPHAALARSILR
jgi:TolA-binding protein